MFDTLNAPAKKASPMMIVGMLAAFAVILVWAVPALLSGDFRWFVAGASAQPQRLSIWADGHETTLVPSDRDYPAISQAATEAITHIYGLSEYGPSVQTIDEYRQSFALEVFYAEPLQIHSRFNLGHPRHVMVPLTGTGYKEGRFFIGSDGSYWAAGPRTHGDEAVRAAVNTALNGRGILIPADRP